MLNYHHRNIFRATIILALNNVNDLPYSLSDIWPMFKYKLRKAWFTLCSLNVGFRKTCHARMALKFQLNLNVQKKYHGRKVNRIATWYDRLFQDHCIIRVTTFGLFFPLCWSKFNQRLTLQGNNSRFVRSIFQDEWDVIVHIIYIYIKLKIYELLK